jgi:hypothetical protein
MNYDPWQIEIAGSRLTPILAIAMVWPFGLAVFALLHFASENEPLAVSLLLAFSFPAIISYYGLKSAFLDAGRVRIDSGGFSIARGFSEERHAWSDVERFYVDLFGTTPVYEGRQVPHFRLNDGTVSWLPSNLGLEASQFVTIMERLRQLAGRGWPYRPRSIAEVLKDDFDAVGQPKDNPEPADRPQDT